MTEKTGEFQYLTLCKRIVDEGVWIKNERTGKKCLTVINADMEYDASEGKFPLITTRKAYWKSAIAEMLGYLRGYQNAKQFADLGCRTWFENADSNEEWLRNLHRRGEGDLGSGFAYSQGRFWGDKEAKGVDPDAKEIDQYKTIVDKLSKGIDDRRLIMTFNNPGVAYASALPACMHTHNFSVLDGTLYLTSYQRSSDLALGVTFNMVQTVWLLRITAQITGLKPGKVFHKLVNCHIYEDQLEMMKNVQLKRLPLAEPTLIVSPLIKTLDELENYATMESFEVKDYRHHEPIRYPFSV